MTNKQPRPKRITRDQRIDQLAEIARSNLKTAGEIYETEPGVAYELARNAFPMAVWVAQKRLFGAKKLSQKPTAHLLRSIIAGGAVRPPLAEKLRTANQACVMGIEDVDDTTTIIQAGLSLLDASESYKVRQRATTAKPKPQPSRFQHWATAAVALLTVRGAS